jgi:hypothetical protein
MRSGQFSLGQAIVERGHAIKLECPFAIKSALSRPSDAIVHVYNGDVRIYQAGVLHRKTTKYNT